MGIDRGQKARPEETGDAAESIVSTASIKDGLRREWASEGLLVEEEYKLTNLAAEELGDRLFSMTQAESGLARIARFASSQVLLEKLVSIHLGEETGFRPYYPSIVELAANKNLPSDDLTKLYRKAPDSFDVQGNLAVNPNTSPEILKELYEKSDPRLLPYLAENPNTPESILEEIYNGLIDENIPLLTSEHQELLFALGRGSANRTSSPFMSEVTALVESENNDYRTLMDFGADSPRLAQFSFHTNRFSRVRRTVAESTNSPEVLKSLVNDPEISVRIAALKNPATDDSVQLSCLDFLRENEDHYGPLIHQIIRNRATSERVIREVEKYLKLSSHAVGAFQSTLKNHPNYPVD